MKPSPIRVALMLAAASLACAESPTQPATDAPVFALAGAMRGVATAEELQAALDAASAGASASTIRLASDVTLGATLDYSGAAPLTLDGQGHTITGPVDRDAFTAAGGGHLTFRNVRWVGAADAAGRHGLYVEVPAAAGGTLRVRLDGVELSGFGLSGLWLDDQVSNSAASIDLHVRNSVIRGNGFRPAASDALADVEAVLDFDGIRANEGGPGDLRIVITDTRFEGNAGDGFEGDEKGAGDAVADLVRADFLSNGSQPQDIRSCQAYPELADRPAPCDDYPDLEDGFDIDEDDDGSVVVTLTNVSAKDNMDEGIDLDELGDGDIRFVARTVFATGNRDENIKLTESDPEVDELEGVVRARGGDVVVDLANVVADGSVAGRGARFEEFGPGGVYGVVRASSFSANAEDDGIRIDEADDGAIDVNLQRIEASNNDGQGLQVTEDGSGDVSLGLRSSFFLENGNTAVQVEEAGEGGVYAMVRGSKLVGADGEEALEVEEEDAGGGTVTIRGSEVTPAPIVSEDVTQSGGR